MRAALRESLLKDDLDSFRAVVEPLSEEFDLFEVALAAVRLAHETSGTFAEEEELPEAERSADDRNGRRKANGRDQRRERPAAAGTTRLFVGTGRASGVRPQDLVGAITGESSSPAGTSVRSRSPTVSPSSRSPSQPPTTWSRRSGRPASRAGGQPFAANAIRRGSRLPALAAPGAIRAGRALVRLPPPRRPRPSGRLTGIPGRSR